MPNSPPRWRHLVRSAMAATLPRTWFLVQGPKQSCSVCLTFDDGPHPEHTPRLLDVLGKYEIPATFFVVGRQAERYPELVRRLMAEGHTIGHHSYSHSEPRLTSAQHLLEEVRRTRELLSQLLGQSPNLFRPPCGKLTGAKLLLLWRAGQTIVLWNVDPKDYALPSAGEGLAWFQKNQLQGGDIVLMHDNQPHASEILPTLIRLTLDRGFGFTTASQWT